MSHELAAELQVMELKTQLEDLGFIYADPNENEHWIALLGIQVLSLLVDAMGEDVGAQFEHESKCADCNLSTDEIFGLATIIADLKRGATAINLLFLYRIQELEAVIAQEEGEADTSDG